jgi:hypothetical protein
VASLTRTSADAVVRETAWLRTVGDGLPALAKEAGGPFDVVQAYMPRTPALETRCLFVLRPTIKAVRFAAVRSMNRYQFKLRVWWPANDGKGEVEDDQQALDDAVELVLQRIGGTPGDKTHGGRFLSVAENGEETTVQFLDPMRSLPDVMALMCDITYPADDPETLG